MKEILTNLLEPINFFVYVLYRILQLALLPNFTCVLACMSVFITWKTYTSIPPQGNIRK